MPNPLVVVRHLAIPISDAWSELRGLRIAHVSDVHFRGWSRVTQAAQDLLLALPYDLLLVTGDFGNVPCRWTRAADMTRRFFGPIAQRVSCFAALGNHDHPGLASAPNMPLVFLKNQSVIVGCADGAIELVGLDQTLHGEEDMAGALAHRRRDNFTVLLAHYPSTVYRLPKGRVDLQLSGHTHGGQIRLPWLGCLWTNDRIGAHMSRGLHAVQRTLVHVSPGIGLSPPLLVRVNCLPEITILTLRPADRPSNMKAKPARWALNTPLSHVQV